MRVHHCLFIPAIAVLALAACAPMQPSPYGPRDGAYGYGFMDEKLDGTRWRISFASNAVTPRETLDAFVLYRAAELTLAKGYDRFAVTDRSFERHIERTGAYPLYPLYHYGDGRHRRYLHHLNHYYAHSYTTFEQRTAALVIIPYRGAPPEDTIRTEDAHAVKMRLGPAIKWRNDPVP